MVNHLIKDSIKILIPIFFACSITLAKEYHVSPNGSDYASGDLATPFKTISYAAQIAQAGDTVMVHEGIYRESVNPINGGTDYLNRILYRTAPGEKVVIKGSEIINTWQKYKDTIWKVVIPNAFFKDYNPYKDELEGDWLHKEGITHHTGEVFLKGQSLFEKNNLQEVIESKRHAKARNQEASIYTWYAEVDEENTTIWANFHDYNPNNELVEINVRNTCFYPESPGINYITVRGFIMDQAATQWAAPTAEQVGLLGTHWSKGWIIEDNIISNSKSVGITLGKDRATGHNVWSKKPDKDGATHYNEVIFKAYYAGWSKENIGSHIVRNNVIFNCGQAGIVGSLGAVFSEISNNHIYDVWTKRIFGGYEMAGIKIHASIDMTIKNNRIHNTGRGIWLDWMAQGTRVSGNLLYDNTTDEVNHGPYLVDNNIFLSDLAIRDWSEGGAFVNNLIAGYTQVRKVPSRSTPYHFPHSTKVLGVKNIDGGDNRYYNNIFLKTGEKEDEIDGDKAEFYGLHGYSITKLPNMASGNIYYNGAKPLKEEKNSIERPDYKPLFEIEESETGVFLNLTLDDAPSKTITQVIASKDLGITFISEAFFENPDGTPYYLDADFFSNKRNNEKQSPGPFKELEVGKNRFKVW